MRFSVLIFCVLLSAAPLLADSVVLKNGDKLTGELVSMTDSTLTFNTESTGEVKIKWEAVETLITEKDLPIHFEDGQIVNGKFVQDEWGNRLLRSESLGDMPFEHDKVASIAPPIIPPWSGSIKLNSSITKGNTDTLNVGFFAEAIYEKDPDKLRLYLGADYQETDGDETVRKANAGLKYDRTIHEAFYGYALLDFEYDKFKDLDLRTKIGVGAGYKFINTEKHKLNADLGLLWISENYIEGDDDSYPALRFGEDYTWQIHDKAKLVQRLEYIPNLRKFSNYLFNFIAYIEMTIIGSLIMEVGFENNYNSNPPADVKRNDFKGYVALGYKF